MKQLSFSFLCRHAAFLCVLTGAVPSRTQAQTAALQLPEMRLTSFRGYVGIIPADTKSGQGLPVDSLPPGGTLPVPPGAKLFEGSGYPDSIMPGHAIVSLPGAGALMVSASVRIPKSGTSDATLELTGESFLNINPQDMARQPGKVFKLEWQRLMIATTGARFFVRGQSVVLPKTGWQYDVCGGIIVGVLDGAVTITNPAKQQPMPLKAGEAIMVSLSALGKDLPPVVQPFVDLVVQKGIVGTPRPLSKAEAAFDICCKLAALGKPVPSSLPAHLKAVPKTPNLKANSLGMMFLPVPGTKLRMCIHETRHRDFAAYVATNPPARQSVKYPHGWQSAASWGWEDHLVIVSWEDANDFCTWLSQKEGKKYRLPIKEEWEKAALIKTNSQRATVSSSAKKSKAPLWGDTQKLPAGMENHADLSYLAIGSMQLGEDGSIYMDDVESFDDGYARTAPVMSFEPNALGFYDFPGNVSEWCQEWFDATRTSRLNMGSCYFATRSRVDWSGPPMGSGFRVVLEE